MEGIQLVMEPPVHVPAEERLLGKHDVAGTMKFCAGEYMSLYLYASLCCLLVDSLTSKRVVAVACFYS